MKAVLSEDSVITNGLIEKNLSKEFSYMQGKFSRVQTTSHSVQNLRKAIIDIQKPI